MRSRRMAKEWFGATPPDLSRRSPASRGADWLYTYLRSFYRDPTRPTGWNNRCSPTSACRMCCGSAGRAKRSQVDDARQGARIRHGSSSRADGSCRAGVKPGSHERAEYDALVADLVNFLVYMGEPTRRDRARSSASGAVVPGVFFVVAYCLKKEYWKDVH